MTSPVWFITGASSGFGRSMTELVLASGGRAVATLRRPEVLADLQATYPSSRLLVLTLDVTKQDEILAAFASAKETFGRIDVVFNNAGYSVLGEVEGTPDEAARAMFDVTFWGATNVSREAIRFFRDVNQPSGGRLIVSSSVAGLVPAPAIGYYSAAKHALEAINRALAIELDPEWNIKITLVEYAAFETKGLSNCVRTPPHPAYSKPSLRSVQLRGFLASGVPFPGDVGKAMQKLYELSQLENPPTTLALGKVTIVESKRVMQGISDELDQYASWSEDLDRA